MELIRDNLRTILINAKETLALNFKLGQGPSILDLYSIMDENEKIQFGEFMFNWLFKPLDILSWKIYTRPTAHEYNIQLFNQLVEKNDREFIGSNNLNMLKS